MPLPLTTTTAADAYAALRRHGNAMKERGQQLRAQLDAGTVYPQFVLDVLAQARFTLDEVPALAQTPGLGDYIRAQVADPLLDLTVPLQECLSALGALMAALVAEYPRDVETGMMLDRTLGADGVVTWTTLPGASMPQTSAALDTFLLTLA